VPIRRLCKSLRAQVPKGTHTMHFAIYMHVCIWIYVCIHICVYACMYAYIHILYTYQHTHTHKPHTHTTHLRAPGNTSRPITAATKNTTNTNTTASEPASGSRFFVDVYEAFSYQCMRP
jgi:formate hydrogenlyase subunit 6/NADH:ubiquinone oxidoreductase subunit I